MDSPTREIFWQISYQWPFYLATLVTLGIFLLGVIINLRFVFKGAALPDRPIKRLGLRAFMKDFFSHKSLARGDYPVRQWHLLIFYGFAALFFVTCYIMAAHYGSIKIFSGRPYLLLSFIADIAGAGLLIGLVLALIASINKIKAEVIEKEKTAGKIFIFLILGAVCVTGFLLEGLRIHLQKDPASAWSPLGFLFSQLFIYLSDDKGPVFFKSIWWLHSLLALGFLAWIPFSSGLRHMLYIPFNRTLMPVKSRSLTSYVDLKALSRVSSSQKTVRLGLETVSDITPKQRLGLLSCMSCSRCERLCPALQTGQTLSPRKYLNDLRNHIAQKSIEGEGVSSSGKEMKIPSDKTNSLDKKPLINAVSPSSLWACRLCKACEELCPAGIEHVMQIIELRRAEVLNHGRLPAEGATALRNLSRTGNPYGVSAVDRSSWVKQERLATSLKEDPNNAWLLWTGCFQPGDEQKPKVLSCLTALLKGLNLPFFVLPDDISCCGDPARILGDEDLFQELAKKQIRHIRESGTKQILVHCPHCYTVLNNIYPQYGSDVSVMHTSEFFQEIIQQKQLIMKKGAHTDQKKMVYHDPCFLGRYQSIFESPRNILTDLPGLKLHELTRHGPEGFCCGAGGGHFFMDLDLQERPSTQRMEEILAQKAEVLALSCGFCFSMFDDALRRLPDPPSLQIADWLELLHEAADIIPEKK